MISIAIDGPSGAGKSTISRKAAEKFGFIYVDTGAIYRTIGLATKIRGVSLDDTAAVVALLPTLEIELKYNDAGEQHMYLDGNDVSRDIRLPEVSMLASKVSAIPAVREFLVDMQRGMAEKYDVIMDGRDIGTVILPNADLKIFLTADVRDRARAGMKNCALRGWKSLLMRSSRKWRSATNRIHSAQQLRSRPQMMRCCSIRAETRSKRA